SLLRGNMWLSETGPVLAGLSSGRRSGLDPANRGVQLLVAGMGVDRGRQRARMPGETLGEVEVLRGAVDIRDRRMSERMEGVVRLEPRRCLPLPKHELDPPERDPTSLPR